MTPNSLRSRASASSFSCSLAWSAKGSIFSTNKLTAGLKELGAGIKGLTTVPGLTEAGTDVKVGAQKILGSLMSFQSSGEAVAEARAKFRELDKDNSGSLEGDELVDELVDVLESVCVDFEELPAARRRELAVALVHGARRGQEVPHQAEPAGQAAQARRRPGTTPREWTTAIVSESIAEARSMAMFLPGTAFSPRRWTWCCGAWSGQVGAVRWRGGQLRPTSRVPRAGVDAATGRGGAEVAHTRGPRSCAVRVGGRSRRR